MTGLHRWIAFGLLVLAVVVTLRAPILHRSVVDWDESVYLLVAQSMTTGELPYREIWDHKQPFLYVLMTLSFVLPDPVLGMRLLACCGVALTALLLALMVRRVVGGWIFSGLAALLYVLATMASGGLATNTEILFAPFVVAAYCVLLFPTIGEELGRADARARFGLAGVLCGLAVLIKLVAVFEVVLLAFVSLVLWWSRDTENSIAGQQHVKRGLWFALGVLAPAILTVCVFWLAGGLDDFLFANFGFNFAYTDLDIDRGALLRAALGRQAAHGNLVVFLVALVGGFWLLWKQWRGDKAGSPVILVGISWSLATFGSVYAGAKFYDHHLLQILPPTVFLATLTMASLLKSRKLLSRAFGVALTVAVVCIEGVHAQRTVNLQVRTPDVPRLVGQFLEERLVHGEVIYVANSQPIIYLLAGGSPPNRYVQPVWVVRPELRRRLGLDLDAFLEQVFDRRPSFVVLERDNPWLPDRQFMNLVVDRYLRTRYRPVARFDSVFVFEVVAVTGD